MTSAACLRALLALCSPSAEITFLIRTVTVENCVCVCEQEQRIRGLSNISEQTRSCPILLICADFPFKCGLSFYLSPFISLSPPPLISLSDLSLPQPWPPWPPRPQQPWPSGAAQALARLSPGHGQDGYSGDGGGEAVCADPVSLEYLRVLIDIG